MMKLSNVLIAFLVIITMIAFTPSAEAETRAACYDRCLQKYHYCANDKGLTPGGEKVCSDQKKECEASCPN